MFHRIMMSLVKSVERLFLFYYVYSCTYLMKSYYAQIMIKSDTCVRWDMRSLYYYTYISDSMLRQLFKTYLIFDINYLKLFN